MKYFVILFLLANLSKANAFSIQPANFNKAAQKFQPDSVVVTHHQNQLLEFLEPFARSNDFQLPGGKGIFYMPEETGRFMGYPIYHRNADSNYTGPVSILFTEGECLPFTAVTRQELVLAMEVYVQGQMGKLAQFQRTSATRQQNGETLLQKYKDALKRLGLLLESMTAAERRKQAVVYDPSEILWSRKTIGVFESQERKGGRLLVSLATGSCSFVQVLIK